VDRSAPPIPDATLPPDHAVTDITAAFDDTCAVAAGTLYCWGALSGGSTSATPVRVPGSPAGAFAHVSGGTSVHCATRTTGTVFCWGNNDRGELGQGDRLARQMPARVLLPAGAESVSGKFESYCARTADGALHCWGQNDEGQMGQSDIGTPMDALIPVRVGTASDWVTAAAGQGHTCAIRGSGQLYCWGRNTDGELGLGPGMPVQIRTPTLVPGDADWRVIATGQNHTCGIRATGRLYCFGDGEFGQLGVAPRADTSVPVEVGDGSDWRAIAVDTFHSCGLRGEGTLWCWGRNVEGQLGTGDIQDRDVPAQVGRDADWAGVSTGRFHTCARKKDGTAYCTGANDGGKLGTGDTDRRNVMTRIDWGPG
jgi:alpha-tubulin suppressor-like RCC1 family protein